MRISSKSSINPYLRNLENIQNRKFNEEAKLSTGKEIMSLSDNPKDLVDSKQISAKIEKNKTYISNIDDSLSEQRLTSEIVDYITQSFQKIREIAIDSTQIGSQGQTNTLAKGIKGILEDVIKHSNESINGKLLFSGTKTLASSIEVVPPAKNTEPYELIETEKTLENPSGLKVIFKGNNEDRIVNKDNLSTEIINVKSNQLFGENLSAIESIINLYNLLSYKKDGTDRGSTDVISLDDFDKLNNLQQNIAQNVEKLNQVNSEIGSKINRLELYRDQFENTNIRLNEIKSMKSDADVAETALNLKMEESALQYSLQVGSRLLQNSLFDFLK